MPTHLVRHLVGWHFPLRLRRTVRVARQDDRKLVVSIHGHLDARQTERATQVLLDLLSRGPEQAHIDIAHAHLAVGMGDTFVRVSAAARSHRTRVTVHRASRGQRATLRRLGLDRFLLYSDQPP